MVDQAVDLEDLIGYVRGDVAGLWRRRGSEILISTRRLGWTGRDDTSAAVVETTLTSAESRSVTFLTGAALARTVSAPIRRHGPRQQRQAVHHARAYAPRCAQSASAELTRSAGEPQGRTLRRPRPAFCVVSWRPVEGHRPRETPVRPLRPDLEAVRDPRLHPGRHRVRTAGHHPVHKAARDRSHDGQETGPGRLDQAQLCSQQRGREFLWSSAAFISFDRSPSKLHHAARPASHLCLTLR